MGMELIKGIGSCAVIMQNCANASVLPISASTVKESPYISFRIGAYSHTLKSSLAPAKKEVTA
jgi:hypothetical protein